MAHPYDVHIAVFAREPAPGQVKTRLVPSLGAAGAADLHRLLVARTLETVVAAGVAPVELCVTPDVDHPILDGLARRHGVILTGQGDGDLGTRMARALTRALTAAPRALVVGADCPVLSVEYVQRAAAALALEDAVLGPAEDGGYVLLGLGRTPPPGLFAGIRWGGADVCDAQRARLQAAGLRWTELETLWDLDRPDDLARYEAGLKTEAAAASGEAP